MTAEELVKLIREANSWDSRKVLRVFDGEGIYSYLINHGADEFAKKMKNTKRLRISDLEVGDIITDGEDRYAILNIEDNKDGQGADIYSGTDIGWIVDSELEDFKKTGESVAFYVDAIVDTLQEADD